MIFGQESSTSADAELWETAGGFRGNIRGGGGREKEIHIWRPSKVGFGEPLGSTNDFQQNNISSGQGYIQKQGHRFISHPSQARRC